MRICRSHIVMVFCLCFFCGCSHWGSQIPEEWLNKERGIQAWAYFYQGVCLEQEEKWMQAAESFYKSALLDSNSPRTYSHLGKALLYCNIPDLAIESLKKAEEIGKSDDYLLYFDIGTCYQSAQLYSEAKRCYMKAITIFPGFQKGNYALEFLLEKSVKNLEKKHQKVGGKYYGHKNGRYFFPGRDSNDASMGTR